MVNIIYHIYIIIIWLVVWNIFIFSIYHIWDVILPIDELHDFSRR